MAGTCASSSGSSDNHFNVKVNIPYSIAISVNIYPFEHVDCGTSGWLLCYVAWLVRLYSIVVGFSLVSQTILNSRLVS